MVKVVYIGAFAEIELYVAEEEAYRRVKRGDTVEFPTEFAERLLEMLSWTKAELPGCLTIPAISGTPAVGETLTASHGSWTASPSSYTYQWYFGGEPGDPAPVFPIEGETSSTLVVPDALKLNSVEVRVTAKNGSGLSRTPGKSQASALIPQDVPENTVLPTITGTLKVGKTLTGHHGTWVPAPGEYAQLWTRANDSERHGEVVIEGAEASTYALTEADLGKYITFVEDASAGHGFGAIAYSHTMGPIEE